ncbi:hypothetical protein EV127DRAFT_42047 [Xylaria flabelliformis]|nr:hypothetical protein EV127DRAFT_42047 [Xylaria flabelliformis]
MIIFPPKSWKQSLQLARCLGLPRQLYQLGTATFQFYQQLHSLHRAIKNGENDLNTAIRRLDQHGDFIKELRFNFERISGPGVSASTRDLFERYIADSETEVGEFRNLLDRVGKRHFKRKSLQAVETGSRLRFHEHNIQKYCDLLDKQMQRFLFLQSSVQSMRMVSTLSEVMDTLVKQGAKAVAFYDEHSSKQISKELHLQPGARSNEIQLPSIGAGKSSYTAPSLRRNIIPSNWTMYRYKSYHALCGTITVTELFDPKKSDVEDRQFAYIILFEPYGWVSRRLVEWRCLISSAHRTPTLMLSVTTSIICEDPDVIDALGLVICTGLSRYSSYWGCYFRYPKIPNLSKVRALLDTGRLLKEHVLYGPRSWSRTDVLTAYDFKAKLTAVLCLLVRRCFRCLASYDCSLKTVRDVCCSSWSSAELLRYYREFCDVTELLLSRGFEPTLSSWQSIYHQAVKYRWRVSQDRPALIPTMDQTCKSIFTLILNACGYSIPVNVLATSEEQLRIQPQLFVDVGATPDYAYIVEDISYAGFSHLGHLIARQLPAEIIRRDIPDLNVLDLTDEQYILDRWFLGLFAPCRPEIASLLQQYLKSYKTTTAHKRFEVEYIREEFRQWTSGPNASQRKDLLEFICFHGNATILQQLDITVLTQSEMVSMLYCASQISAHDIFDILISHMQLTPEIPLLHTKIMRERLAVDEVFLRNFVGSLKTHGELDLLSEFFRNSFRSSPLSGSPLFATISSQLPVYMRNFIVGLVQRYRTQPTATECVIHSLIYYAMIHHWLFSESAEHLLQDLHLYWLLDLVTRSSAVKSSLDISSHKDVDRVPLVAQGTDIYLCPSVNGYSPLMLALHCGMSPAVRILVDAGASILTPSNCGKSPLSVAYEYTRARHPRRWIAKYDRACCQNSTSGLDGTKWIVSPRNNETMWISENTDKEMLEILLKALRDRGEAVEEEIEIPIRSKWEIFEEKTRCFARWLFKPSYTFDSKTFRENSIYTILVSTLWFLSVLKVLKAELGDVPDADRRSVISTCCYTGLSRFNRIHSSIKACCFVRRGVVHELVYPLCAGYASTSNSFIITIYCKLTCDTGWFVALRSWFPCVMLPVWARSCALTDMTDVMFLPRPLYQCRRSSTSCITSK